MVTPVWAPGRQATAVSQPRPHVTAAPSAGKAVTDSLHSRALIETWVTEL